MSQKINQRQFSTKYSTTEQLTGDVWIDGKPIYRKVVNFGSLPNATTKSVAHGITGLDATIKLYGYAVAGASKIPLPNPMNQSDLSYQSRLYINATNIIIAVDTNESGWTGTIILEYTKT